MAEIVINKSGPKSNLTILFRMCGVVEVCRKCTQMLGAAIGSFLSIGCPKVIRSDCGTENSKLAKVHIAFRMNHDDSFASSKSFIYGPSTANTVSPYTDNSINNYLVYRGSSLFGPS